MGIKYREYEIRHTETGCVVFRDAKAYGPQEVRYRKDFPSLLAGLEYIVERLASTESKDIQEAIATMKYVKNDLKIALAKSGIGTEDKSAIVEPEEPVKVEIVARRRMIKK